MAGAERKASTDGGLALEKISRHFGIREDLRRRTPLLIAATLAMTLSACEWSDSPFARKPESAAAAEPATTGAAQKVGADTEAPQVFQTTDTALWDGRPSLGGVWVASPDVTDPERVIMRNPANGRSVIGALFKRERDNPGPKLQISSDAAEALGLLAGQPAKISVTALRRETVAETAPVSAPKAEAVPALAAPPPATAVAATPSAAPQPAPAAMSASPPPAKPTAKPAPAPATSGKTIQVGFFSQEANADRARDTLAKAGVTAQVRKDSSQGKDYWSVQAKGDAASLQKIKSAGFADAYMLK